ncbi:Inhibitor of sigma-G Gin [Clostridium acidisoli DSM 12555]|jgi:hypothetical protein|uniref:Inhibitor of sigma-G Gin n=1 Tax=Clostridium acidisoli DSM 12555 TaxID=1121291 RepID=A0A1W1XUS6_9CLOT|nr:sigma factor G inhibitor Gin [Clostridium acidisoli]SMC27291.1 Inhibitor of sigma-G Gin [Clostridium acidisoli DSM 12555]
MKKHNCIICNRPLENGIIVNGKGICNNCESRLVNLQVGNDFYEYYKHCIKKKFIHFKVVPDNCQDYQL